MNFGAWLLWGFAATVVLTTLLSASQTLGFTRMNLPYLLGTMLSPNRDRAKIYGILIHLANGWIFSMLYIAGFHLLGRAGFWIGAIMGLIHGLFVTVVGLPLVPGMHPRMASPHRGPTPMRLLEPPGPFGVNYGIRTPISILLSHVVFGLLLGALYPLH
jgi:hypothetical protein